MSNHEQGLIDIMGDPGATPRRASEALAKVEESQRFDQLDQWSQLARDPTLADWQHRGVFTMLTRRGFRYPLPLQEFLDVLGLREEQLVDASMEQNVPISASEDSERFQTPLPFGSHLYLATNAAGEVVDAAIFPSFPP